jgi:Zn-dependent protease with chaperone function
MAEPALIRARWFSGQSSRSRDVLVALEPGRKGPTLRLHVLDQAHAASRAFSHDEVEWPAAWSAQHSPERITVALHDAGSLEIDAPTAWQDALRAAGDRPGLTQRMQTHWPVLLGVLIVAAIALAAFYRYGTPWAAAQLARHVPLDWEQALSARALEQLDAAYLKPSALPPQRQAELRTRFDALQSGMGPGLRRYPDYVPRFTLSFRSGIPANAFALPGGSVVMTDGLVVIAEKSGLSDDALIGVLAHEIGHVVHRHGTRLLVEQGVLQIGLGLAMGDVSSIVSFGSTLLTAQAYRRQHETEADCFAIALMRSTKLPTGPMADLLLGISSARDGPRKDQATGRTDKSTFPQWLSSHPDTRQRAEQLKSGQPLGCPS